MKIAGVDFTSAPGARKPITIAVAHLADSCGAPSRPGATSRSDPTAKAAPLPTTGPALHITAHLRLSTLDAFERWLAIPDAWAAGFDFPFGLPRDFLCAQDWDVVADPRAPQPTWAELTARLAALSRFELVARCRAWTAVRPAGAKFAHRATDRPAGSSPSMKWVNPPVALMLHAGAPRLLGAGVTVPGLHQGDPARIALEAYPGMLARTIVGRRSYKSDDLRKQDVARRAAREEIIAALEAGDHALDIAVRFADGLRRPCLEDASGDTLDAVLCAVEAAWGWHRRARNYGLPAGVDPLEGWIVGAGEGACQA